LARIVILQLIEGCRSSAAISAGLPSRTAFPSYPRCL
jgi:hypothetical protein